jgi:RimJ/RimL family protein N-acetyltransferase
MAELLRTDRLLIRDWSIGDAEDALKVYGNEEAARWVAHDLRRIVDLAGMRAALQNWLAEQADMVPGTGRWAMTLREDSTLIGGITLLPMPVPEADVEMGYRLAPRYWGRGYASEAARALAHWAFAHSLVEVFALVVPENVRAAATAQRIGMEWVGESDKYHGARLEVYRLRPDDLVSAGNAVQMARDRRQK